MPRAQIAQLAGLSPSTVNGALKALIERGVVAEDEPTRSGTAQPLRGRPASVVRLSGRPELVGVLAMSHSNLATGVLTMGGTILSQRRTPVKPLGADFDLINDGVRWLGETVTDAGRNADDLSLVVLGVPGPLRDGGGFAGVDKLMEVSARDDGPVRLPAWMSGDLAARMSQRLGIAVKAENDANLGALGEAAFGAGVGLSNILYVKLVDGVGAGLVINGQLVKGAAGMAGEIAHIQASADGPLCRCGRRGCLAAVLSTTRLNVSSDEPAHPPARLGDVFTLAAYGGSAHTRALIDVCRMIGRVLADVCLWLSPDAIVLDGMLQGAAPEVLATITDTIRLLAGPVFTDSIRVVIGELGADAELFGGLAVAKQALGALFDVSHPRISSRG